MKITIALPKKTLHTSHNVLGLHGLRALLATTVLISIQHSLIWLLFSLHWPLGYSLLSFYSWSGLQFPAWGFPTRGPNLHLPLSPTLLSSVQPLSRVWLFATMDCSTSGFPVHHQLSEFTQTHVHWVSDAIQPSFSLSSPSPPAFNLSQNRGLFTSLHQVAKVLEFQLQHQSLQWIFRTDFL